MTTSGETPMTTSSKKTKPRILVVDDNPAIHDDFRKILVSVEDQSNLDDAAMAFLGDDTVKSNAGANLDVELDSAYQGKEGFKKVVAAVDENRPYSLVFCDMRMPPGWDGLQTIEKIFAADPNVQVVICSAYSDNTWATISDRLGMPDRLLILKKPFDNAEVLQIVVALVEKRRLIDAASSRQEELERIVQERTEKLNIARMESERLLAAIDSLMIRTDANGLVRMWNEFATETFGLEPAAVIGQRFDSLPIRWEDPEPLRTLIGVNEGASSARLEMKFLDADENFKVIGFSSYPVYDDGKFHGTLVLGANLSEHRMLEQQLHNAQKLESVGQLAAGVAHEINTPMQYVGDNLDYVKTKFDKLIDYMKSSIELLNIAEEQGFESERVVDMQAKVKKLKLPKLFIQIPEALNDSIDGVGHVSRIVKAMKELSHPGSDEMEPVDLNRSLETTLTISANEWKYVAETKTELDSNLDFIQGFSGELSQVFLNLIVNAAHAISDVTEGGNNGRGTIIVRSMKTATGVRVEIADTGGGIPKEIRERVFDPFFTTKEVGKGTGQGLAIAHSVIVQKHGGMISFEVVEGVGTTFIIDLPTSESPTVKPEDQKSIDAALVNSN